MQFPSRLVEKAVEEFSKLPGIGKKTALRLVLHLLKRDEPFALGLAESIKDLRSNIKYCKKCHNISDHDMCNICKNHMREQEVLCVVQDTRDVMAIENTGHFQGMYHVLGGVISPIEGISPGELNIDSLIQRVKKDNIAEVIFALNSTMEADTTAFYISKLLKDSPVKLSALARGIPIGGELEYADELTLGRSIMQRMQYVLNE